MEPSRHLLLRAILEVDPENVAALVEVGWAEFENDNYDGAVELLERACGVPNCGPEAFFWLAKVHYHDCARLEQAKTVLERCLREFPAHVASLSLLAGIYVDFKRDEESLELALKAHSLEPSWPVPLEYLDGIYSRLGEIKKSIQCAQEALRLVNLFRPYSDASSYSYWESAVTGRWVSDVSLERMRARVRRRANL